MGNKTVDFYFDFGSPAAWLAYTQLSKLQADTGATVVMKPMLLGGVFQSTGNRPPISVPLKGSYLLKDMGRYARRYGVPLVMNPHFPVNTITLMRADVGLAMRDDVQLAAYRDAVFRGMWVDQQAMAEAREGEFGLFPGVGRIVHRILHLGFIPRPAIAALVGYARASPARAFALLLLLFRPREDGNQ